LRQQTRARFVQSLDVLLRSVEGVWPLKINGPDASKLGVTAGSGLKFDGANIIHNKSDHVEGLETPSQR